MTNVMVKTCLNQKIIKNSNLIHSCNEELRMSESESYPYAEFFRKPNLAEYLPNVPFLSVDWTQDMIIVSWREVTLVQFLESRICPNIYRMFRSVDWTHDMIIVKWHLFIWHERKLCALTNAPPIQSTQMSPWLSTLFHANFSAAQVYALHPGQFIFAVSCRRRSFLQVLQSTGR